MKGRGVVSKDDVAIEDVPMELKQYVAPILGKCFESKPLIDLRDFMTESAILDNLTELLIVLLKHMRNFENI